MTVTIHSATREGPTTVVLCSSDLGGSPIYFHWYIEGAFIDVTTIGRKAFTLEDGDQLRFDVLDTLDADFDSVANAPDGYPPRRTLVWERSTDTDVDHYRIEQQKDAEDAEVIGLAAHEERKWQYQFLTPRLVDGSTYTWTITAVDEIGNDSTALTIGPELIVRTPDAPNFTINVNPDPGGPTIEFVAA